MTSTVTRSQSIEHLWDAVEREILIMDVQTTNLQQLRDAIMTILEVSKLIVALKM